MRLGRPVLAQRGTSAPPHPHAARALKALQDRLKQGFAEIAGHEAATMTVARAPDTDPETERERARDRHLLERIVESDLWEPDSKEPSRPGRFFVKNGKELPPPSNGHALSIGLLLDRLDHTSDFVQVQQGIEHASTSLDYTARQILSIPEVLEYLFAYAWYAKNVRSADGVLSFLTRRSGDGWKPVYDYVVERALDLHRIETQLHIGSGDRNRILTSLRETPVSLARDSLDAAFERLVGRHVFSDAAERALSHVEKNISDEPIADPDRSAILQLLRQLPPETLDNRAYVHTIVLDALRNRSPIVATTQIERPLVNDDYSVDYYQEDSTSLEFDRTSVEAAAQLFFVMVWGDELGVFEVIDRLAAQTSMDLQLQIRRQDLAEDLALYVLDGQFRDLKTGRIARRVPRAEREMFYRQLFGVGNAQVTDGMRVNREFARLWAVLMTEVARYISKVEESPNATGLVSKQRVLQAIEDLQYNLSAHCVGMTKVAAPVMYREMDFVIRRLLSSEDITSQFAGPGSRSFLKVIERIRGAHDLSPLRNKGRIGHQILSTIAKGAFTDEQSFMDLVSAAEGYIVAESQLAPEEMPRDAPPAGMFPGIGGIPGMPAFPGMPGAIPGMPQQPSAAPAPRAPDGWNF
ncbi:hypothetical protein [Sandaracinus amylolyticus]|uniref:hypothetical protein n=1 Tax=Sandaracinus amylolyticus TaxID=927083 RepID=UPI001F2B6E93|nr:hypothetical protein [Sandaracinus amylolyticus]